MGLPSNPVVLPAQHGRHLTHRAYLLLLAAGLVGYVVIAAFSSPPGLLGRHAWDEANYLNVVAFPHTDFLHFYPNFDPKRVDYNGAFLVYWPVLIVRSLIPPASFDALLIGRALSVGLTLLTGLLFYLLFNEMDRLRSLELGKLKSAAGSVLFLLAPVTLWYGDKYKLEPMVLAFAVLAFYLYLHSRRYSPTKRHVWATAAALVFGTALSIKSVYLFAAPVFFVDILLDASERIKSTDRRLPDWFALLRLLAVRLGAMLLGVLWPFLAVDAGLMLSGQDPIAHNFFVERIRDFAAHTGYFDPHLGNVLIDFLHNTLVGALSVYVLFLVVGIGELNRVRDRFLSAVFVALTVLTTLYAVVALPHNSSHDYHAYYFLLPTLIGFKLWPMGPRAILTVVPLIALANLAVADASYGLVAHRYNDPNGNLQAIQAGQVIGTDYRSRHLEGTYVLNDSPVVTYYARVPSFDYNELFIYRGSGRYDQFGISADCQAFFLAAQEYRPISLVYLDPNVVLDYYKAGQPPARLSWCESYIAHHFHVLVVTTLGQPISLATSSGGT